MKVIGHIELTSELIKKISAYFPSKTFKSQSHLFYEGQVPIAGYLILNGSIKVSKRRKFQKILQNGTIIGLFELLNRCPIAFCAEAFPNTEVCFIDRTTLLELKDHKNSDIYKVLGPLFERNE